MANSLKSVLSNSHGYVIDRVTQGNNGNVRIDATPRFGNSGLNHFSKWVKKSYFDKLCNELGRKFSINY
jgi:hypothetical protein